jgi:hypothetical protein
MPRKYHSKPESQEQKENSLASAIQQIKAHPMLKSEEERKEKVEIVDIITFCDDPSYLDLPNNALKLWLSQRVILKCFYMGSIGNEFLKLTEEEWTWLYSNEKDDVRDGMAYKTNIKDVLRKVLRRTSDKTMPYFKELHLVLGRRSSKTLLASIITTYEAYKLLVVNDGDPHGYYNLPQDDEIAIINVALSQQQAGRLFGQVQSRIRNSPFFKDKIAKETTSEIRLLTKRDMQKREDGANLSIPGSILLLCGHSNPDSLAGYSTVLILFDEIAFFDETGKVTGKYFYGRLKPSLAKFYKYNAARIVQISSPNAKGGVFYETFLDSEKDDDVGNSILSFQLPTWSMNPDIPYDNIELQRDRSKNIDMFMIEYGAQWAEGGAYNSYFESELIDKCLRGDLGPHKSPQPGCNYYMHVDPAKKGANYVAVLVAKQRYTNMQGRKRNRCILAGIWIWRPKPGLGLLFGEIDKQIIQICSIFHPISVTYDDYHSVHSIQLLRSHGINTQQIPFNRGVKAKLYQNLRDLLSYQPQPELLLYNNGGDSSILVSELKNLKQKQNQRGITILPDKHADVPTDDASDCLAGACSSANDGLRMALPEPVLVRSGLI